MRNLYLLFMVMIVQRLVMVAALALAKMHIWFIEDRVRKPLTAYLNRAVTIEVK